MFFERPVHVVLFVCLGVWLVGCAEHDSASGPTEIMVSDQSVTDHASSFVPIGEFEGSFDAATGALRIDLVDFAPSPNHEFRTQRHAYGFCNDLIINSGELGVSVNVVPDTLFRTVDECIPADEVVAWGSLFYTASGAFCTTVRVENRDIATLGNVIAEITEITHGYEGYTYRESSFPACCGTGADLSALTGQNVPTDLSGGAFLHATSMATGESGDQQWTFANAGGSFSFRGRLAAQLLEIDNGRDDDCDGRVDNGLGEYSVGEECREDADCANGMCQDIFDETGIGACAGPCEPGTFGRDCAPCTFDCGENGMCDDGLVGTGECVCKDGWTAGECDTCVSGRWGADCLSECESCGRYGACREGLLGDGRCLCTAGGYGPSCQFSCTNGIEDGDEVGVDCGGPTCGPCPIPGLYCNDRGVPDADVGLLEVTRSFGDWCDLVEPGICLQRGTSGILYNEGAGETRAERETSPQDTAWTPGSCAAALAGSASWRTFRNTLTGLMRSANGLRVCMVATATGNIYDFEFLSWSRTGAGIGGFAYRRTGPVCLCDAGFHGADCEFSCTDGLFNGDEFAIDCGGSCAPCADLESARCNFRGTPRSSRVVVDYVADDPCYFISDGLCLGRSAVGGPPFNSATGHSGGRDGRALEGSFWAMGRCGDVIPWSETPFSSAGNSSLWMFGEWCVVDRSTGLEHTITITGWDWGRGGGWSFNHIVDACVCDEGTHGAACQFSCSNGVRDGDEDAVDCGGACGPCARDWECNFNGVSGGTFDFEWDGSTCDFVSDGVCLARGTHLGLFNVAAEASWTAESPANTRWAYGSCNEVSPTLDWRAAVWADGDGPRSSVGEDYCMLDTTTGVRYDMTVTDWVPAGRGGGFSYRRTKECACARGFHGTDCSASCTDGIRNGDESLVDCGGRSCGSCADGWECNYRGESARETFVVRLEGTDCDRISAGTCLNRSRSLGGPLHNEASGARGGHDHSGLNGTAWEMTRCSSAAPVDADPFSHQGNGSGWMYGGWCMLDRSTGIEHDIDIVTWGSGRRGTVTYVRSSPICTCDLGAHGLNCENTCSDGIQNGDEEQVDCGGESCGPCLDGWQCGYNGTFRRRFRSVSHIGNGPCYSISDGVCLGRSTVGGPPFNAVFGRLGGRDGRAMEGTLWGVGSCETINPSDDDPFGSGSNNSGWQLREWCMLDLSTGLEHTITIDSWTRSRGGGWSFIHRGGYCRCDTGFHGSSCEYTCWDGIQNGDEDHVDCGGSCDPCEDGWQCDFNGTFSEESTEVVHVADAPCFSISEGLCLGRSSEGGPPFNAATGHIGGHDHGALEGSYWGKGRCGEAVPIHEDPFIHRGNSRMGQLGEWCVLDRSTGIEHTIEIESWDSERGGGWSYTHTGGECTCDADTHGGRCEFSCSDGVANGEEDTVDCGGPCAPCVEGWECSYNGTFAGAEVVYDQVGGDGTCDPISEGVCLTRGTRQGIFNLVSESVYIAGSPAGTLWSSVLPCGSDFLPSEDWRSAVGFAGEGPRSISGRSFCMLDQTTGHEWTVVFDSWARSATGGAFSYTRRGSVCECDPGFSGETCADTVPAP